MRPKRPDDFGFLAGFTFLFALLMAGLLAATEPSDTRFVDRTVEGLAGALGLLTAEALWFVRKWAYRATQAFVGMLVLIVLAVFANDPSLPALAFVAFALLCAGMALRAVHRGLHPRRASSRIPLPARRP